jgi:YidC/Oxa1 family membrane protein insertase
MLASLWNVVVYEPFYNGLIFLSSLIPAHDVGIAIILLTIIVKVALYPLARKAVASQLEMKAIEGELNALKEKYGTDRAKLAQETMALYKKHGVNPASGCLPMLIQIPFIIGLYTVFLKGIMIDPTHLYSFVPQPEKLNTVFLGLVELSEKKHLLFAFLAGASQFVQAHISAKNMQSPTGPAKTTQEEFAQAMQTQMKYVFPAMITVISYQFSVAVALYWVVSNIVSIVQDVWTRRSLLSKTQATTVAPH